MAIAAFPPGHVIGDRFRIVRKLGEGGMAVVYEAIDQKLGERRALKFAKAGYSRLIPPETRSALRVTHDNICRTYEIHTTGAGVPVDFISMEFIEGETLQARCQREILSDADLIDIAKQLCGGLDAAHRAQILHRDLKGNNVMLTRRPDGGVRAVHYGFRPGEICIGRCFAHDFRIRRHAQLRGAGEVERRRCNARFRRVCVGRHSL